LLASIITNTDDAIVSKDLSGIVTSWNKGAERMFGFAADEMIGRSITTIIPPDRQDEELGILATSAAVNQSVPTGLCASARTAASLTFPLLYHR
jgi:PAS domain S-box-containing protein